MSQEKKYTLKELQDKLEDKERIFCHEYIIDWNGSRAARKAGYSENRDRQTAYDLVTKSYIQQYIDFIKNDYEKEAGISKLKQIKTLLDIISGKESSQRDKISATAELNKMMGYNEPEKLNLSGEVSALQLIKASESGTNQD
jgi:phage terminase small subunit